MNAPDYLSRLQQKNKEKNAPGGGCIKGIKGFTQFTQTPPSVKKAEIPEAAPLSAKEETAIRAWMARMDEDDPPTIEEIIDNCRRDPEARAYFLEQARKVPAPAPPPEPDYAATCGACRRFQRTGHPHLGHCAKRQPEAPAGLWATSRRWCRKFEANNYG